jgi:hypothetical protein
VDAAESSPLAAQAAASLIRKFLTKDNYERPHVQYNAIMLVRILSDNPGKTFTRNLDAKFVGTVKDLLRMGKDLSVQQILRETLDAFEKDKKDDQNLMLILEMWAKEKKNMAKMYGGGPLVPRTLNAPAFDPRQQGQQQNYFARNHRNRGLPPPDELAGRIEEARTSAKLLLQVVQSTPPSEVLGNDLIKEFADRCQSASRSVQGYIHAENPAPDDDTLLTLIETNDQLSLAISKHQRAILQARKALNSQASSPTPSLPINGPPAVDKQMTTEERERAEHEQMQEEQRLLQRKPVPGGTSTEPPKEDNPFSDENQAQPPPPPPQSSFARRWSPQSSQQGQRPAAGGMYQAQPGYSRDPPGAPQTATMHGAAANHDDEPVSPIVSFGVAKPFRSTNLTIS